MIKNPDWALKIVDKIEDWSKRFFTEAKKFRRLPFSKMKVPQMIDAWQKVLRWNELSHGVGASIAWHADADKERITKTVSQMIARQIKKRGIILEPTTIFSVLSAPLKESFIAKEEKEFLEIAEKIFRQSKIKKIFKLTRPESLEGKIKKQNPKIFKLLFSHFQKWTWLPYGYKGPAYTFFDFLERWQTLILENASPKKLLAEIADKEKKLARKQKEYLSKLKFNSYQLKLIKLTQGLVFIKDFRKGALYHGMYCYEPFFREVASRLNLTLEQVWTMNAREIEKFLKEGKAPKKEFQTRTIEAVAWSDRKKYIVWTGKKARNFFNKIPKEKIIQKEVKEFSGTPACTGHAKGIVKIIEVPEDMIKMKQGDILVSETTYPSLVPAMKKAAAIVTNAGGLTCHAAIVSRELNIPCVVGTKIANKVLKDGQLIEVDAARGVIRLVG
jgi:phosphoenolpyruvate synthase/pyruvate phosphate dikinase